MIWTLLYSDRHDWSNKCGIRGYLGGDYVEYCLLGCDAVQSGSIYSL
jgi:hypothetical protein